uniref:Ribonuclease H-like domain-containing protein n=1 Tax=Tanacetum cinerariifolium TaxID=118510 RepID=A0A6L2NL78_TANCI|nr:ribonuclease H-like domain-containing protein [Tanacetum cinerariifolium]
MKPNREKLFRDTVFGPWLDIQSHKNDSHMIHYAFQHQVQDYALWDVIENGNSFKLVGQTTTNDVGTSTTLIPGLVTTEEMAQKKNDAKARNTMSINDLYNNFKIVEQEVKGTTCSDSSSTAYGVSTASTQSSTASTKVSTANLSDAIVYAFLSNQSNGSQLVHEDLEQIHKDDLEEMDLKWQLALLSMRAKRFSQKTGRKITINGSDTAGFDKYKLKESTKVKESSYVPLFKKLVSEDKLEKKTVVPTDAKIEFVKAKQQEKPVKLRPVNTARPNSSVVNSVRANHVNAVKASACIRREFSVARTPQQNSVTERGNRTLIKADRTMLADSKLPTTFWAKAVNTACYV